jgi:hypothetical protein
MKSAVLCDVTPCGSCKNRRIGGTYRLHLRSVLQLLVTAKVPSSPILFTLKMEAISSTETSVLTLLTLHYIQGDGIFHF